MSNTAPPQARTGDRHRGILPGDGTSAADISGVGAADGPGATRQVPIAVRKTLIVVAVFGQPGTAGTILPNAPHAGHSLVLPLRHGWKAPPAVPACPTRSEQ